MKLRLIALSLILAALVGCGSDGPTPDAIAHSMQEQMRAQLQFAQELPASISKVAQIRSLANDDPEQIVLENVNILDSEEMEDGDYRVKFTIDANLGDNSAIGKEVVTRVRHTGNGWHVDVPR